MGGGGYIGGLALDIGGVIGFFPGFKIEAEPGVMRVVVIGLCFRCRVLDIYGAISFDKPALHNATRAIHFPECTTLN